MEHSAQQLISEAELEKLIDRKLDERIEKLQACLEASLERTVRGAGSQRLCLLVFSGDMDRMLAAFMIATSAAAMGMQVTMYFTFWGIVALRKQRKFKGKSVPDKMMTAMLPGGPHAVGTSKMSMLGAGPAFFKMTMKKKHFQSLPELIALAREMGVKLVACEPTLTMMGIERDELLDGIEFGGAVSYVELAAEASVNLFV